jgi:hypothetical protein
VRYLIISFLFFLTACTNRTNIPENIIPPDSMQMIMLDVIEANDYSNLYIIKDTLKKDKVLENQNLLEAIFKIHHTNRKDFQESLKFYESRPDLNKKIFDSLAAYANRHRPDLYKPRPQPVKPKVEPVK